MPATKAQTTSNGFMQMNEKKKTDAKRSKDAQNSETPISDGAKFDELLDDLQIPSTLRPKLYGMDASVKAAIMKSSQNMAINPLHCPNTPTTPPTSKGIRRAHSTESLRTSLQPTLASLANDISDLPYRKASHSRGMSLEGARFFSKSRFNLIPTSFSFVDLTSGSKHLREKGAVVTKNISPTRFCSILTSSSSTQLDVEDFKKLRLLLRNESASWSEEFIKLGGYTALLTRLNQILEVEWREEQPNDQILHELLRCFKALSTSSIGCFALRSSCPAPFVQLVTLLHSDKKPGEVATRQLIVEVLHLLFDLYPPSSLPATVTKTVNGSLLSGRVRPREAWESQASLVASKLVTLPAPHKSLFSLIRALLLTPAPPPSESSGMPVSPHAFIESLHVLRIYKTYLQELSDVCRDYFWVFCHPNNTIWDLAETNENGAEKPRAPEGMMGGVEFGAMSYFTTQLKLVNAVAKCVEALKMPKEHEHSAYRFHTDLFLSGLEQIILISRKASTTYYPTLHLELARYIAYAARARYELPYTIARLIGLPPPAHGKNPQVLQPCSPGRNTPAHGTAPTRHPRGAEGTPRLPSPVKVETMRFD